MSCTMQDMGGGTALTPLMELVDLDLRRVTGGGLVEWLEAERSAKTWRAISLDLYRLTGRDVPDVTLLRWHARLNETA